MRAAERFRPWSHPIEGQFAHSPPHPFPNPPIDSPCNRPVGAQWAPKVVPILIGTDNVTVHSLRVTALTTARERSSDIIELQDFAGHADPRTTLTYTRSRDRLSKSPAYVLKY